MRARIAGFSTFALATLALPMLAGATTASDILAVLSSLFNGAIVLFITLAIVVFFWGLIQYIVGKGSGHEGGHGPGTTLMFWGVIAIFVMVSIWGLVRLLQNTFGVGGNQAPIIPQTVQVGGNPVLNALGIY